MDELHAAIERETDTLEALLSNLPEGKKSVDRHHDRAQSRINDARMTNDLTLIDAHLKDAWHEYHTARMLAYKPTKDARVFLAAEEALESR